MFTLVQFDNDEFYVCKATKIKVKDSLNIVSYKGSRYAAKILANHIDKEELLKLKEKFEKEIDHEDENDDLLPSSNNNSITLKGDADKFRKNSKSPEYEKKSANTAKKRESLQDYLSTPSNVDNSENSYSLFKGEQSNRKVISISDVQKINSPEGFDKVGPKNVTIDDDGHECTTNSFESTTRVCSKKPTIIEDRLLEHNILIQQNTSKNEWQLHTDNFDYSVNSNSLPNLSTFELSPKEAVDTSLMETAQILLSASNSIWDNIVLDLDSNHNQTAIISGPVTNVTNKSKNSTTSDENLEGPQEVQINTASCDIICPPVEIEISGESLNFYRESNSTEAVNQNDEILSSDISEYIPDSDENSDENNQLEESRSESIEGERHNAHPSLKRSSIDFDSSRIANIQGNSAPDDGNMYVATVESGSKRDFCIYCNTHQVKLSRHLLRKHKFEEHVAELQTFPKGSNERKKIMAIIRKKGHYAFNTNHALNTGERKVVRRPNARYHKKGIDFATCATCLGDYAKNTLRHHVRRCTKRENNRRNILFDSKRVTGRIHRIASNVLRQKVFPTLQDDEVVRAIRYDELVILFGNKLCQKYKDPHFYDMIRQKIRQLGRFLLEIRKRTENVNDFFSVFYPKNYDATLLAVQSLAGLNESQTGFERPSLATSIGTLIKQIGKLCISEWIKRQEKEKQVHAEDFLKLLTEDYTTSIACTALESYAQKKRQKKIILPSNEDIQKLQLYLRDQLRQNYRDLQNKFSDEVWINLASLTLISLQLFNRRRPGETERILIRDFKNYEKINEINVGNAYNNFSEEEKQAAKNYVRFLIRGKLNRTVPILMHIELVKSVELLLQLRNDARVRKDNPYLFGIPGTLKGDFKYLRSCELIRRYSEACGAKKPQTLRGTSLRKHVATMCVNFNLTDGEVSDLAEFMGHAERIHKEHYRQPIIARDILKISKLLEAVQGPNDSDSENEEESDEMTASASKPYKDNNVSVNIPTPSPDAPDPFNDKEKEVRRSRKKRSTSPYGKCKRTRWTAEEKKIVLKEFQEDINAHKLPSFIKIQELIDKTPKISGRNLPSIKSWISNQIKKKIL